MRPGLISPKPPLALAAATAASLLLAPVANADNKVIAIVEMADYLEFVDCSGGVNLAEQVPLDEWLKLLLIDARDAGQFRQGHIPGAINMYWRQVLAQRESLPKYKPTLIQCSTGSLSAQAGFALRVAGWENARFLQGGMEEWKAKGGFDAAAKAAASTKHQALHKGTPASHEKALPGQSISFAPT